MTWPDSTRRILCALLILCGGRALADDSSTIGTISTVARRVAEAFDEGDHEEVRSRARDGAYDPWLLAEELLYLEYHDAAAAFAAAAEIKTGAALVAYVRAQSARPPDEAARAALVAVVEALRKGGPAGVVESAEALEGRPTTVMRLQVAAGRANALRGLDRLEDSMVAYEDAARGAREIGWLGEAGRLFRQGGRSAYHGRLWKRAQAQYQMSRDVYAELGIPKRVAELTGAMALALERQGRYPEALQVYEDAMRLFEENNHRVGVIEVLFNAGEIHSRLGRPREVLADFRRGLGLAEARRDRPRTLRGLLNVSAALIGVGRYAEALPVARRARDLADRLEDGPRHSGALSNIGIVHLKLGDYAAALETYRQALAHAEAAKSDSDVATVLQNTGLLHARLGRHETSLACYVRALEIALRLEDRPQQARLHTSIGNAYDRLGQDEEAEAYLLRAAKLAEELGDRRGHASALANLAATYSTTGRLPKALELAERAAELSAEVGNPTTTAGIRGMVGVVYERMGRFEEALATIDEASRLLEEAADPTPDTLVRLLWARARVLLALGRPEAAATSARRAVFEVSDMSGGLADAEGASAREAFAGLFEAGMRGARRSGDAEALAWFFEQGRAGMLREGLGARDALSAAVVPDALREEIAVAEAAERHALTEVRKARRGRELRKIRAANQALCAAQDAVREAVARVQRESKKAAAIVFPQPDDLATIRARLSPHEALLYYGLTKEEALALVVRRESVRVVKLESTRTIDRAIRGLLLDDAPHIDPAGLDVVRERVAAPLELEADVRRVLVCPMGRLGFVPFALLFPDREVAYLPSGTTHGMLLDLEQGAGREILAVGDPAYGAVAKAVADVHRGRGVERLPLLPGTRKEVEAVGTVRLLGERATESGLRQALHTQESWRAVHFACHGLLDPERPSMSSLALTPDTENDGFLTCLEVFRMKIPADLVVLSACETGKGTIYMTEGIVGLTRAFMFAGSPRVICSLWMVDDDATRALMTRFYELWNPEQGPPLNAAAALKAAQAHVRSHAEWEHPYYWAAWALWGLPD